MLKRLSYTTGVGLVLATALTTAQAPAQPGSRAAEQQTPPAFTVDINYVEVDARVVDAQGGFVRNLTKEDFQILEDRKSQTISVFALVDMPFVPVEKPLFADQPIESDVATNSLTVEGRLYVIVLDDLHTAALRSPLVKSAARRFILERLGAHDLAAVVTTSGRGDAGQDFTENRRLLLNAVDKFQGQKLASATAGRIASVLQAEGVGNAPESRSNIDDPDEMERGFQAQRALSAVKSIADAMSGVRGRRKALIYISEGIDYDTRAVFTPNLTGGAPGFGPSAVSAVIDGMQEAIAAASRSNISIYTVDPRGLTTVGSDMIEIASLPTDQSFRLDSRAFNNEIMISQDNLRTLADETGGFATVNQNNLNAAFDKIVQENSSYYVLGYYPTNEKLDGKFRKIEVRLPNRRGLVVRARKGYGAPRGNSQPKRTSTSAKPTPAAGAAPTGGTPALSAEATAALTAALTSPLPLSGLTMNVSAISFKGVAPNAMVAVLIEARGGDLKFSEKDGKFNSDLNFSIAAFDKDGKAKGSENPVINLTLKPDTHTRVVDHGIRLLSRMQLAPGKYQLRVAARESVGSTLGSVHYDLEVPDFSKGSMVMSGLALSSLTADPALTLGQDALFGGALPAPPTAMREFPANDELATFVEVYDNQPTPSHKLDITCTVQADDGRTVFKSSEERSSDELKGTPGGYGFMARIPLKDLTPGLYVMTVEARSRLSGAAAPVSRVVQFRVR